MPTTTTTKSRTGIFVMDSVEWLGKPMSLSKNTAQRMLVCIYYDCLLG